MVLENTLTQWGEIIPEVAFLFYSICFSERHCIYLIFLLLFHEYRILIGNKSAASKMISSHCDLTSTVPNFFSLSFLVHCTVRVQRIALKFFLPYSHYIHKITSSLVLMAGLIYKNISVKFVFSKKATKIDEIFPVDLTVCM